MILTVELLGISVYLRRNRKRLDEESTKNRCGYIFEELNYKIRGGWTLSYPILYQMRFVVLAVSAVILSDYLVLQVMGICLSSILITAVLGSAHPLKVVSNNYKEIGNEAVIILILDLLLFSSDPCVTPESRAYIGYAMIGVLGLSLCFSQGALIMASLRKLKLSFKRL